jgi:hypothetical protein
MTLFTLFTRRWLTSATSIAVAFCCAVEALGLDYLVTELPSPNPNSLNNHGQVVYGGAAINDYGQIASSDGQNDYLFTPSVPNGSTGTTTTIVSVDRSDFTTTRGISATAP